jgi:hypothetical protein
MNNFFNSPMDDRKRLLLILSIFPLTLLILLIFRDTIREWVVIPLLYLFWFINQGILGLYQGILWFVFLILILSFTYFSLKRFNVYKERFEDQRQQIVGTGRMRHWTNLLNLAGRGGLSHPYIASQLREELYALIAYRKNLKPFEVERQVESGELVIPEDIRRFLYSQNNHYDNSSFFTEIVKFWRTFLPVRHRTNRDWVMKNIERTIAYMEEILELNDDHANQ